MWFVALYVLGGVLSFPHIFKVIIKDAGGKPNKHDVAFAGYLSLLWSTMWPLVVVPRLLWVWLLEPVCARIASNYRGD